MKIQQFLHRDSNLILCIGTSSSNPLSSYSSYFSLSITASGTWYDYYAEITEITLIGSGNTKKKPDFSMRRWQVLAQQRLIRACWQRSLGNSFWAKLVERHKPQLSCSVRDSNQVSDLYDQTTAKKYTCLKLYLSIYRRNSNVSTFWALTRLIGSVVSCRVSQGINTIELPYIRKLRLEMYPHFLK